MWTVVQNCAREALLLLIYVAVSASVLNIFMQSRSLEEGSARFGLAHMLDGSAERPFVKRQLLPLIANPLTELVPAGDRATFVQHHLDKYHLRQTYFGRARHANSGTEEWTPDYAIKFHIIYALMFASLLGTLYLLRAVGHITLPSGNPLVPMLPVGFALLLPLSFLHGSFMYDFLELFFFAALLLAASRANYPWWLVLLPLAVLNKETAILAPLIYAPLLWSNCRRLAQRLVVLGSFVTAGAVFVLVMQSFQTNPGGSTQWHLAGNLAFWARPGNYLLWSDLYAPLIPVPRGLNAFWLTTFGALVFIGWKRQPLILRRLYMAAAIVNMPLFLLFTYRDEMRNLSMLFIPGYLLVAHALLGQETRVIGIGLPRHRTNDFCL
jgi:hypothetical protein